MWELRRHIIRRGLSLYKDVGEGQVIKNRGRLRLKKGEFTS